MKKIILLTFLTLHLVFAFAQKISSDDAKMTIYDTEWGTYVSIPGHSNIAFSGKLERFDKDTKLYTWLVRWKSFKYPIAFEYKITNQVFTGASDNVEYNGEYNDGFYKVSRITSGPESGGFSVKSLSKTTLFYQIRNECYKFNGRDPACESQGNNSGSITNQSNNTTTTPQKDLTEYNRSKAEMEQKVQEENERRQQQATQLNNQKQQFINVYNEGVQLGNTGKYSEAAAKYQQAIGLATNDIDRQTAQNAYNKVSKANQQTQAINQLSQATISLISSIQEGAKQRKEKKQLQEANRNQQIIDNFNGKRDYYYDVITMENEELGYYTDYVAYQFEKLGYQMRKSPLYLMLSVSPYGQYGGRKNCIMYYTKDKDTLAATISVILSDFNEENMKKYRKLERTLSIVNSSSNPISQRSLKTLYSQMFRKIVDEVSVSGTKTYSHINGKLNITPSDVKNSTSGIDFTNNSYKGHKIEFTKATTIDTANNIDAYKRNASIYYAGLTGSFTDYDDAIEWFAKAAVLGDTSSLYMMAVTYEVKGYRDPLNFGIAMRLYKEIVSYNCEFSPSAMCSIGDMYSKGSGIPKDCDLAIQCYERAANSISTSSISSLRSLTHIYGKYGCHPDKQLEKKWLEKLCLVDPDNSYCK